ncbi:putative quinol monooxygenase [Shewanella woodyi]|uniref:putative quinol monooxygenase n=1 Tax=Shewanella woodyi TaxID=60961 RepID=UPI00374A8576
MINLIATFQAKTGKEIELKRLLLTMLAPTRNEPGSVSYKLFNVRDDSTTFIFQESFANQAAFEEHCQQPHFTQLLTQLDGLLEHEPEIKFLELLDI